MANKNSKRRSKLARKERAQTHWAKLLGAEQDKYKNTIKGK